ncbi:hypothetical protein ACO0LO_16725 [Undibacterium sp. TJN25]|uniref:hypothetical protein n=1 Tax=Undibacterium sp. TJN25 TaxID=3413056 RepID=UPI003BF0217E
MNNILEIERNLLLAKMRSSRVLMRQKFVRKSRAERAAESAEQDKDGFPRSHALRLLMQHPVWVAAGALAFVVLGPRKLVSGALKTGVAMAGGMLTNPANIAMLLRILPQISPAASSFIHSMLTPKNRE